MWRQVVAKSPDKNAPSAEVLRYDVGWKALNTMLKAGRSLSGHERNCCFLNTQGSRFADISAAASLDFDDDGRVLALADWDLDGDLDFWIANRTGPQVRFLRNDAANDHNFVAFKLEGVECNRDAIGTRLELHLSDAPQPRRVRTLRAGEGYLAQSSKWLHFGLGEYSAIDRVVVKWPDGSQESLDGVEAGRRYVIRQGDGHLTPWHAPNRQVELTPSTIEVPAPTDKARIVLISPLPLPPVTYKELGSNKPIELGATQRPKLVNLWATWCQPCIKELGEWKQHASKIASSGLEVIAINVDEPGADPTTHEAKITSAFDALRLPFEGGLADSMLVNQFDVMQRSILRRQQPLPVPSSFLIDAGGNLRVIYKGPVETQQILDDVALLDAGAEEVVAASVPFAGIWLGQPAGSSPNQLAVRFVEGGYQKEAEDYLRRLTTTKVESPTYKPVDALVLLGAILSDQGRNEEAVKTFLQALELSPHHRQSHIEVATALTKLNRAEEAAKHYKSALERRQNDPELRLKLALAYVSSGDSEAALAELRTSIELRPSMLAFHHMGNTLIALGRFPEAVASFESALEFDSHLTATENNLSWILSTNAEVEDGVRAVELAENLISRPKARTAGNLDTLAASYAAAARFEDAVRIADEAVRISKAEGDVGRARRIQKRLALYRQEKPYRE